jgi:hypothetical protein
MFRVFIEALLGFLWAFDAFVRMPQNGTPGRIRRKCEPTVTLAMTAS